MRGMEGWAKLLTVAAALGLAAFFTARARPKPRRRGGVQGAVAGPSQSDASRAGDRYERAIRALRKAEAKVEKERQARRRAGPRGDAHDRYVWKAEDALEVAQAEYKAASEAWNATKGKSLGKGR